MSTSAMKILCRYQYDPLDRLTGLKPADHVDMQRFYQNDELVNEIEGQVELTILRHEAQPLAQRLHIANVTETTLLATDQQRSVLQTLAGVDAQPMAYTAYGHRPAQSGLSSLLGFNGERPDLVTGHYLLGQGHRAFNPVLMRFNSPDELSPFGDGGINAYAYCGGDPVNRYDPSGGIAYPVFIKSGINRIASPLARPTAQLTALNPSSRAIARTAPQTSQIEIFGSPSELLKQSSTTGPSRAAQLPPQMQHNTPTRVYKIPENPGRRHTQNYELRLKNAAREWDDYVRNNPNTPIDADTKYFASYNKAKANLEAKRAEIASIKPPLSSKDKRKSLNPFHVAHTKAKQRLKRSAWENLKSIRNQQT